VAGGGSLPAALPQAWARGIAAWAHPAPADGWRAALRVRHRRVGPGLVSCNQKGLGKALAATIRIGQCCLRPPRSCGDRRKDCDPPGVRAKLQAESRGKRQQPGSDDAELPAWRGWMVGLTLAACRSRRAIYGSEPKRRRRNETPAVGSPACASRLLKPRTQRRLEPRHSMYREPLTTSCGLYMLLPFGWEACC
jgi:hypothetical protein